MIEVIEASKIEQSLQQTGRQYLAGNLKNPQLIAEVKDNDVEVGIMTYDKPTLLQAHYHTVCNEYQYVIDGESCILDLDTNKEVVVKKGDFFVIHKGTRYWEKVPNNATILFFKYPGGNDKVLTQPSAEQQQWGNIKEKN